jgi:uncharacterized protein YoxC
MRTRPGWKMLCAVSVGVFVLALASPGVVAHTTSDVRHMIKHLMKQTTAIKAVTDALPRDLVTDDDLATASASLQRIYDSVVDIRMATDRLPDTLRASVNEAVQMVAEELERVASEIIDEVHRATARGFHREVIDQAACRVVVPTAPAGRVRFATITILSTNIDASVPVRVEGPGYLFGYEIAATRGQPQTLVETAEEDRHIQVCSATHGATIVVNAQWDERPST